MRWLVTGAAGMLGQDVVSMLRSRGDEVTAAGRRDLDVTDADAVDAAVEGHDVVVNCAAWTAVDDAERSEADAFRINGTAAALVGRAAARRGARLVHVSTDYVFDGTASEPYGEGAPVNPASAYGRTKAAGEWAVRAELPDAVVVRTAWLYGAGGPCFPKTIARVARERGGLDVVDDQVGQPTWTVDLARVISDLVDRGAPGGTYHGTASGRTSWHGFAREIVGSVGLDPEIVRPVSSDAYVRPAPRPAFSVLGHGALSAARVDPIGDWSERWRVAAATVLA